jgi:4-hydroxythreonine-4-phosphate dehydrogenase
MINPIAIIAGEPNSISSEIIFKSWMLRNKFIHKPFFIIGNIELLNKQKKKLNYKIKLKEINNSFTIRDLRGSALPVYNVNFKQKKAFEKISPRSNKYIFKCFDIAIYLAKKKRIQGLINCPISKQTLFKNSDTGITEFISKKMKAKNKEVMLIYNKKLAVSPLTTHIAISQVSKKINKIKIINKVKIINSFYMNFFKKRPKIAILGLNPHSYSKSKKSEEKTIITRAITILKKSKINVYGPVSPDSSFMIYKKSKCDVIFGMYHDQVLSPFKALFKYDAINITLGLPFIRISPDHGTASNILGKKIANPTSLIKAIKFFKN